VTCGCPHDFKILHSVVTCLLFLSFCELCRVSTCHSDSASKCNSMLHLPGETKIQTSVIFCARVITRYCMDERTAIWPSSLTFNFLIIICSSFLSPLKNFWPSNSYFTSDLFKALWSWPYMTAIENLYSNSEHFHSYWVMNWRGTDGRIHKCSVECGHICTIRLYSA